MQSIHQIRITNSIYSSLYTFCSSFIDISNVHDIEFGMNKITNYKHLLNCFLFSLLFECSRETIISFLLLGSEKEIRRASEIVCINSIHLVNFLLSFSLRACVYAINFIEKKSTCK